MESAMFKKRALRIICGQDTLSVCVLRILLGGTFIFSSISKLPMHSEFVNLVNSYHLLPVWMGTLYGTALPWVELVIGAYLLLGILVRPSGIIAGLVSISFIIANVTSITLGEEQCHHCFGEVLPLSVTQALIIDAIMLIIAVYVALRGSKGQALSFDNWFATKQRSKSADGSTA